MLRLSCRETLDHAAGAEIDLVLSTPGGAPGTAVEAKFSLDPRPTKGFWSALDDLHPARSFVVYPGAEFYPLAENVWALPVSQIARLAEREALNHRAQ